eukprot:g8749.t1
MKRPCKRRNQRVNKTEMFASYLPEGFELIKTLGQGGQATVLLAEDTRVKTTTTKQTRPVGIDPMHYDNSSQVAVKCYSRTLLKEPIRRKQVRREIRSLKMLKHDHIIALREVVLSKTHLCLVIDYAAGGTLLDLLLKDRTRILSESVARRFFQQLVTGVDYAHRKGVANRDIKPENILFRPVSKGKPPVLVLSDFGLARRDASGLISRMEGTSGYIAPELYTGQCKTVEHVKCAEIYSCGVCLFQMLFGLENVPDGFNSGSGKKKLDMRTIRSWLYGPKRDLVLPERRRVSEDCQNLLNGLLQPNPRNRLSLEEVWEHPWFKNSLSEEAYEWNTTLVKEQSGVSDQLMNDEVQSILEEALPEEQTRPKRCILRSLTEAVFKKVATKPLS